MTDEPRILTDAETATRRSETARSGPDRAVVMCTEPGCPRAAHYGPWCDEHRHSGPTVGVAHDLTEAQIAEVRAEVDAKAAPLFLLAMDWIVRHQLAGMGLELAPVVISRDDQG